MRGGFPAQTCSRQSRHVDRQDQMIFGDYSETIARLQSTKCLKRMAHRAGSTPSKDIKDLAKSGKPKPSTAS